MNTGADSLELSPIEDEQIAQARSSAAAVVQAAKDLSIETPGDAASAAEFVVKLAKVQRQAEERRKELTRPYVAKQRRINRQFSEPATMLDTAIQAVKAQILKWEQAQARLRAEEQARIDAIAAEERRRDEEERARAVAEARAQAEEWQRRQDELAKNAEEASDPELAEAAERAKDAADALQRLADTRAIEPLPVRVAPAAEPRQTYEGVATTKRWTFEVLDPSRLPRAFTVPDEKAIRRHMHDSVRDRREPELPGVRFWQAEGVRVG